LINLCGRLTQISMSARGTSTEEDFEVVKFIENNAPFTMLLGKPWIEKDQTRRKEEEVLEKKKKELKDFMTRRIAQLIEEQENRSKILRIGDLDVEVGRTHEVQESRESTLAREEVLLVHPTKESQQHEVTMPKEDKNWNGKRNNEMKLTRKKARKLSKKREIIEKLQKVPEGTSQRENLKN
jgi:hypothetical protein